MIAQGLASHTRHEGGNKFSTTLQGHVYFNKQGERKGVITVGQMQGEDTVMFLCNAGKNFATTS